MYLMEAHEGKGAKQAAAQGAPFGPGFPEDIASRTEKLEVWATDFKDSDEYCEFRAFDSDGEKLGTRRINGY